MRDEMNHNELSVIDTPSLVTGALTLDPDQALSFSGPTSYASAQDSTSLSVTGSLSIELFLRLASYPASNKDIVSKSGSYAVQVNASGVVTFALTGTSSVTVSTNTALQTNRWYHIVCVYNGNYAGVPQFGKTTLGSDRAQVDDDVQNNKAVTMFTLTETALLNDLNVSLQYADEVWQVQMRAVVYADNGGLPGALVTTSDMRTLDQPNPLWRQWTWVNFPLQGAVVPAGTYHLGYVADTISDLNKPALVVGAEHVGGVTSQCPDSVTGPSDPFGTVQASNTDVRAVYCNYTAVGRTGREGKALIYIDGALNSSAAYSGGVADTTNGLQICPSLAALVDEVSIWNKALSDVQVATHYNAH